MIARAEAESRARLRRAELPRALLVLTAFAVTLGGVHTILQGVQWWVLSVVITIVILGVGALVRTVLPMRSLRARLLAPLAGALAACLIVVARFGDGTGVLGVIPTAQSFDRFRILVRDAGYSITWQTVPARADDAISFVLAIGVVALVVFAEIAVFSMRLPAVAGIPLALIFLVPGFTPEGRTDGWFFAASAVAFLALLLGSRLRRAVSAVAVAAMAVCGGLLLPGVMPSTDFAVTSSGLGPSVSTGVNPILRLGDDLRHNDKRIALTYSTVSGEPEYLRLAVISDFSGSRWTPGQPALDPSNRPVTFPRPPGLSVGVSSSREVTYVHVANLLSSWLPVPYAASSVTGLQGAWQYLPDAFTVASNVALARGENYTVSSMHITPTPDELLSAGARVPSDMERFLALPPETPAVIEQTAHRVTAGEGSSYEKALALQAFLRSEPFRYSETAPEADGYDGTGVEYVAAFLEKHSGYCIHFASAMAVMAREIGIPSRITVGFQPGTLQNGDDNGRRLFAVTNKDLHAWPELFFSGIGWVRFEPTPSRGAVPDYANPAVVGVPPVLAEGSGDGATSGRPGGADGPKIDDGPTSARWLSHADASGWWTFGGIAAGVVLLLLLPAILRAVRRRRRLARVLAGKSSVTLLWRELLDSMHDAGIAVNPTLTLREAAAVVRRARSMTAEGADALERLRVAVEQEGYGPPAQFPPQPEARRLLVADAKRVLHCVAASVQGDQRVRALMLPPSIVAKATQLVRRFG